MNNIDLNINNYNLEDIQNLFKLDKYFTEPQLLKCKETVNKLHPSNSSLSIEYFNLFSMAYKILEKQLIEKNALIIEQKEQNEKNEKNEKNAEKQYIFLNKDSVEKSCYNPHIFSTRMVTIHTEDRDVLKYPYENTFEVELPSVIKNTLSIELFDITLPTFYYNVSEYLQNNKFWVSIPAYFLEPIEITISSGNYNYADICVEIANQLNKATTQKLFSLGVYINPATQYTYFSVTYNNIERKFTFYNSQDKFNLWFDKKSAYNNCAFDCWKMLNNWGLPYNLGFYKKTYISEIETDIAGVTINFIKSAKISELDIYNTIYMEIDTYNWIDEINPFSISTTDLYNNDFNGNVNNYFAKLILSNIKKTYIPIQKFKRVLPHMVEKIPKLKFRFRYHNGIMVDFMHQQFNFALKFECRFNCV